MTTAYRAIARTSPALGEFVAQFAKVVALRRTDDAEATSFSSPNYIGRINILNPQLLDEVLLAEALVHETIHSFLFMQDQRPLWGLTESPSTVAGDVVSPWSGRELPLSAYVQACCVWFGLLNFWGLASKQSTELPTVGMRRRLGQAVSGFLKGPLLDKIDRRSRHVVEPAVASAVEQMQRRVHELIVAIG
jgi:HEXXH motif-containing protein